MGALLAKMAARRPRLRVLCFGDSLTAGYTSHGAVHHPYEETLVQMLAMAFPDLKIETVEDGVSGATVKFGYQARMNAQCGLPGGLSFVVLCGAHG
jgi:lysophospholipase L1-like esterase